MAVLLAVDAYSLVDDELILPFDTLATSVEDRAWLNSFYPAFLRNGQIDVSRSSRAQVHRLSNSPCRT